ncbi:MAG: error-prone DNA polymerase [Micrococcales bacterium 73-15]|uniref:DNA polymerase III subunit alpha n=1 Tax=Salana multivorans TaxID=120377 RepID=UPI0009631062|nr:DNA polymerase III subunit alpha [Salana multivorans]OJX94216.1 MAG: error-prone DNA polymerase [Micrococcales bacterium 73-15]
MPYVPYAELHAHSAFSFLDGASEPGELVDEAARLGLDALALTDHDGLPGVVAFWRAAKAVGLPVVVGAELSLDARTPRTGEMDPDATHLPVLARGKEGYARLSRAIATAHLVTGRKGERDYGRGVGLDPLEVLAEQGGGPDGHWLVLTGGRKGPLRRALEPGAGTGRAPVFDVPAARAVLGRMTDLFGREGLAVELTNLGYAYDVERCDVLAELAREAGVPAVATGNVHAATPRDADLVDVLAAVRARASLEEIDPWLPAVSRHLVSGKEMLARHHRHPEAVAAASRLGRECAFDLDLVAPGLPPHPVPDGHTEATWLRELTMAGALEKYGPRSAPRSAEAYPTLERELELIVRLEFPGYFLVITRIIDFCRRNGILCQGRGSAANSAVCYALGITAVDAVEHKLLFERFLSDGRTGPPDIDLDIESSRREEVIQFVYDTYGREYAAQVANVISYRPRSAVRDAAHAFGYDLGQRDAWSKGLERWAGLRGESPTRPWWQGSAEELRDPDEDPEPGPSGEDGPPSAEREAELRAQRAARAARRAAERGTQRGVDRHDPAPPRHLPPAADQVADIPTHVVDMAERMLRLPRHLGIHSGGMVMCNRPVIEVCPVEWATMPERTVLQWDKESCADAGLVKFDLLGLGMLTALRLAFEHVAESEGIRLALHSLPQEDPRVYELLQAADTVGVFQVESRAQIATLPRLKPERFYDIVVEVALIRPGPIQGNSVHPYIRRRNHREKIPDDELYPHPLLKPALEKTYGVPLFQEQLMQIAIDAADFSASEADLLRRAMGSKRSRDRMEALRARLLRGMTRKGIPDDVAETIYDKLVAFADFGFPESHAFSFAYLVYASSYLKCYHPEAFFAGLLGAQPMGFYSPASLVADARRHGLVVRRACVDRSRVQAHVEVIGSGAGERGLRPRPTFAEETWLEDRARIEGRVAEGVAGIERPWAHPEDVDEDDEDAADAGAGAAASPRADAGAYGDGDDAAAPAAPATARRALAIRLGLAAIRGVGEKAAERIVTARETAPFADAADLARRARLSRAQLEALATAGALRCFGGSRRQALWTAGAVAGEAGRSHGTSQGIWVQDVLVGTGVGAQAPTLPEMGPIETAAADVWASGLSPDHHPMHFHRAALAASGVLPVSQLVTIDDGIRVRVGGVVTHRQRPGTAQGVTFLSLEDETGMLNVVCSAGLWAMHRNVALRSRGLVVRGMIERTDGVVNLLADGMRHLPLHVATTSRDFQ